MAEDDGNGRVTLAVLKNEIDHLKDDVKDARGEIADISRDVRYLTTHQAQLGNDQLNRLIKIESTLETTVSSADRMSKIIERLDKSDATNSERWIAHKGEHAREVANQKWFSGILATVLSSISAIIGTLVKSP